MKSTPPCASAKTSCTSRSEEGAKFFRFQRGVSGEFSASFEGFPVQNGRARRKKHVTFHKSRLETAKAPSFRSWNQKNGKPFRNTDPLSGTKRSPAKLARALPRKSFTQLNVSNFWWATWWRPDFLGTPTKTECSPKEPLIDP